MNGWRLTKFMSFYVDQTFRIGYCLVYGLLTPLSKIFQLFCVGLSYIWKKLEKNTNLLQVCDKFYHMLYHITHISPHAFSEIYGRFSPYSQSNVKQYATITAILEVQFKLKKIYPVF
jgi:hypothetical protein